MRKYGVPYKGSKNAIAEWVVDTLPQGERLVDLFAGGCAITHCAMLKRKYKRYLANDVNDTPRLFLDAVNGKFRNERRWISREDFFRLKDTDPYVRCCWSFGNDGNTYLYSREIEPYKRACHYAIVFDEWTDFDRLCPEVSEAAKNALHGKTYIKERRLAFGPAIVKRLKAIGDAQLVKNNSLYNSCHRQQRTGHYEKLQLLQRLQRLQSLQSLQSLQRLERLERLQSLQISQKDYREVEIRKGDVVYCDIPYDTKSMRSKGYNGVAFDHAAFREWALSREFPVFISEYDMPEGFTCIDARLKANIINDKNVSYSTEKIFIQTKFADTYKPQDLFGII